MNWYTVRNNFAAVFSETLHLGWAIRGGIALHSELTDHSFIG
jgi:hypothetical protein